MRAKYQYPEGRNPVQRIINENLLREVQTAFSGTRPSLTEQMLTLRESVATSNQQRFEEGQAARQYAKPFGSSGEKSR